MKKIIILKLVLIFFAILTGCQKTENNLNKDEEEKDIKEIINTMKGYSCDAKITAVSNKGQNEYIVNIQWENTGKYIIKTSEPKILSGNIILFDGKGIWQYNPNVESKISFLGTEKEFKANSKILVSEFMKNYLMYKNSEEEIYLSGIEYLILTVEIEAAKDFSKQKLWIDLKKKVPVKLETYDKNNNVIFSSEFTNFKFNPSFDEKSFSVSVF